MREYVAIIGLDERESEEIRDNLDVWAISHLVIPKIIVNDGQLWVEAPNSPRMVPVNKVVYHGIFENDLNFMVGLSLWGGPCLPNPRAMMDCRMKLPCLVRALDLTRFGHPRGYASPYAMVTAEEGQLVAKWGNWHCGENKERFTGTWTASDESIIEPFFDGQAVRVVIIGDQTWQICLEGDDWLKSIHHDTADFMDLDEELLEDTENIRQGIGLEIIANDYIVTDGGEKYLLEVNHIPNVTRFPEIWEAYRDYVIEWVAN